MQNKPLSSPARNAFTLIELLVVISIIAMLIAILLPSLGQAKSTARQLSCLTNIRTLVVVTNNYLADNKLTYPRPAQGSTGTMTLTGAELGATLWFNAIDPYLGLPKLAYTSNGAAAVTNRNYSAAKQCIVYNNAPFVPGFQDTNRTLKMNDRFGSTSGDPSTYFTRESDVHRTQVVLFFDGRARDVRPTDTASAGDFSDLTGTIGARHGNNQYGAYSGGCNVAFTDGSARLVVQPIDNSTAAPSWYPETIANFNNGRQRLQWYLDQASVP